jgi:hypothetical protein
MAAHWPTSTAPYAAPMNDVPKVVFSTTLAEATWPQTRIARGRSLFADLPAALALTLVESRRFACGVVTSIYRPCTD